MQVSCTSPSNLHRLLAKVRLRWKKQTQQKLKRTYASVVSVGATCDSAGICSYKEKKKWRESVKYLHSRIDRARFWRREISILIADMATLWQEMEERSWPAMTEGNYCRILQLWSYVSLLGSTQVVTAMLDGNVKGVNRERLGGRTGSLTSIGTVVELFKGR